MKIKAGENNENSFVKKPFVAPGWQSKNSLDGLGILKERNYSKWGWWGRWEVFKCLPQVWPLASEILHCQQEGGRELGWGWQGHLYRGQRPRERNRRWRKRIRGWKGKRKEGGSREEGGGGSRGRHRGLESSFSVAPVAPPSHNFPLAKLKPGAPIPPPPERRQAGKRLKHGLINLDTTVEV